MTAAILMCDCMALSTPPGECPRKARKHNLVLTRGDCGLFRRREERTSTFIDVTGYPHRFPFLVQHKEIMKQLAS